MSFRRVICGVVAVSIMAVHAPLLASETDRDKEKDVESVAVATVDLQLRDQLLRSAERAIVAGPLVVTRPVAQSSTPRTLPRGTNNRIRKQGGGGAMVIGLVSTLVGVAATVYMMKEMKKNSESD
jgi:hypothetical protein